MGLFNGHAARIEERLSSLLKAVDRHSTEHTRRADSAEDELKGLETGLRRELVDIRNVLGRIETVLKTRNGNGRTAAVVKKTAAPAGYLTGGGVLWMLLERLLGG